MKNFIFSSNFSFCKRLIFSKARYLFILFYISISAIEFIFETLFNSAKLTRPMYGLNLKQKHNSWFRYD